MEYIEVLFAQRDALEARLSLITTKQQQLAAVIAAYQALGGGDPSRGMLGAPAVVAANNATTELPQLPPLPAPAPMPAPGQPQVPQNQPANADKPSAPR